MFKQLPSLQAILKGGQGRQGGPCAIGVTVRDQKRTVWDCQSPAHSSWGEGLAPVASMHFFLPLGSDPSPWLFLQKEGLVQALGENRNLLLT